MPVAASLLLEILGLVALGVGLGLQVCLELVLLEYNALENTAVRYTRGYKYLYRDCQQLQLHITKVVATPKP